MGNQSASRVRKMYPVWRMLREELHSLASRNHTRVSSGEVTLLAETKLKKDERHLGRDGRGDAALACPRKFINKIGNARCISV